MLSDKSDRTSTRRAKVAKAITEYKHSDLAKLCTEYFYLGLDQRVNLLLQATGEEAIALRGEIKCLKHLLNIFDYSDAPFTDSIN